MVLMCGIDFLIVVAAYVIPIYIANSCALLFGGGTPLDFNRKLFNKPILGKGKTFRGTFAGLFFGVLSVFVLRSFIPKWFVADYMTFGVLLVVGALSGDIFASFLKRRFGLERGHAIPFLDQLDFVVGSVVFTLQMRVPKIEELLFIVLLTLFMHRFSNYIAYQIKIKEVPW
jgi:CDP-2,3-bis-(O-geranylgeranyl)-sn-glycerol synthase